MASDFLCCGRFYYGATGSGPVCKPVRAVPWTGWEWTSATALKGRLVRALSGAGSPVYVAGVL